VIRVQNRDPLQKHLAQAGIGTGIHYPIPLHLQKAYESLGCEAGSFPIAEEHASEIISLPMFPNLTVQQQEHVVSEIGDFILPGKNPQGQRVCAV
jgi:dTDP-4-amino-4,6-dideoxygalactose transaminase